MIGYVILLVILPKNDKKKKGKPLRPFNEEKDIEGRVS